MSIDEWRNDRARVLRLGGLPADLRGPPPRRALLLNATALPRRAGAECLGTGLLVAIVIGSGVAAERLSPHDAGLRLLEGSLATALGLTTLVWALGPVSGAQLNPVVTLAGRLLGDSRGAVPLVAYVGAQFIGAVVGCLLANAMFGVPTMLSATDRAAPGSVLAEIVATAGLVLVVFALSRVNRPLLIAPAVGAYIGAAYWFTSSTGFANPAVTVGRMFSDTFAGIAPTSTPWFVGAQLVGGALGVLLVLALYPIDRRRPSCPRPSRP